MAEYTEKQLKLAEEKARKARELIQKVKENTSGRSLKASTVIDYDTGEVVDIEKLGSVPVSMALEDVSNCWRKTNEAIIETAETIKKYRQYSNWEEIKKELGNKVMPISTVSYLLAISNNQVLMNRKYTSQLPNELLKIYHLSMISENSLEPKIRAKEIHPMMKSTQIKEWTKNLPRRKEHLARNKDIGEKVAKSVTITYKITVPTENHRSTAKRIKNQIKDMLINDDFWVEMDEKYKSNY